VCVCQQKHSQTAEYRETCAVGEAALPPSCHPCTRYHHLPSSAAPTAAPVLGGGAVLGGERMRGGGGEVSQSGA
jgi:hypothetical protein